MQKFDPALDPWKFGPALDPRNLFGFPDPTPAAARWEVVFITLDELAAAIAERSGEQPGRVKHLVRAWIRDGLLPRAKIVSTTGKRGTHGEYGPATKVGYFVVKGLRPKGKPVSFFTVDPVVDGELFSAWGDYQNKYLEWLDLEHGLGFNDAADLEQKGQLPKPPPALDMQWGARLRRRKEELSKKKPKIRRLRLNTETLARLLPIARGERPRGIEGLHVFSYVWGQDPPNKHCPQLGSSELYLLAKGVRKVWEIVCQEEAGTAPDELSVHGGDVVAYRDGEEIWRLSESSWAAGFR